MLRKPTMLMKPTLRYSSLMLSESGAIGWEYGIPVISPDFGSLSFPGAQALNLGL